MPLPQNQAALRQENVLNSAVTGKKKENNKNQKNKPPGKTKPTNEQNQGEELKASTVTPPPGKPHGTAWTRMQGGVNPKRSGTGQTLIYILCIGIYIYIYHLEGHAEKTRDRSGIYRKKELRSFQSYTKREAHSRTKWGDKGGHWCFGVAFYYGRVWVGLGSQGHKPSYTRWEPQDLCALHWGAGMGSEGRTLLWGWFCSPGWWHLVGSLLMDHLQRPEHPSPEPGPSLPVPQSAQEGLDTAALAAEAGWPSLGLCNDRVSMPSARGKSHLELVARWGPEGAKPLKNAPRPAQCAGRMLELGMWIWGAMVGLANYVGKARPRSAPHIPCVTPHCWHLVVKHLVGQRVLKAPQHGRGSVSSYC